MSAILHGIWLLLLVGLVPAYLNLIPLSVLAAVLFTVGWKLAKPSLFKQMWSLGQAQFLPFIVTVLAIVFTDLLTGVIIGMMFGVYNILMSNYRTPFIFEKSEQKAGELILRMGQEVSFLNKGALIRALSNTTPATAIPSGPTALRTRSTI